ncbi:hypothetical protein AQS8620_02270 [Aquimixticola soesokkakensis]|uniref:Nucleotide-diphospho-sugar transferase n=1 Tax=Aquimixticola soesokkakensis TaxID=1519096 RepID=A0A1Y5SZ69_9RHOB|nr:hypothetical protein [Aquimixticola soesokkakensis]SLN52087.1 hypothetical protein AQS8620_02270 [Aquimixticola soesokkakensis]
MTNGVIYVATGADYLALAVDSARTLRRVEPDLQVDLFTDLAGLVPAGLFDQIHPVADVHFRAKLDCMPQTRFERTLFLDSDTRVLAPLGDLFDLLDRFEMALAHDVRRLSDLVREGLDHKTPYAFPQLNSGVLLYRRDARVLAFLEDWRARFKARGVARDQIILKDMLWESDLRFYVLPPEFNLRRVTMLDAWEPLDAVPTIVHSHRFMDHMRGQGAQVDTVEQLLPLEREALRREWSGDVPPQARGWHRLRRE